MLIGGLQKFSLIDYPGKISAVVFLSGCNFRCGFCHNPELVEPELLKNQPQIEEKEFFEFLADRKGKLDGVCITGGEPTIWKDLPEFLEKIKKLGFLVKLDTNATNPKTIKRLINSGLVDYFAVDIKNSPQKYGLTVGAKVDIGDIEKTLKAIAASNIYFELRTTAVPSLVETENVRAIKKWLEGLEIADKIGLYAIQQFRPIKTFDKNFLKVKPYGEERLKEMAKVFEGKIKTEIRGV